MRVDMCRDMCVDVCLRMSAHSVLVLAGGGRLGPASRPVHCCICRVYRHVNRYFTAMCMDMRVCMCIDMCLDVHIEYLSVCRHVYTRFIHVCMDMCVWTCVYGYVRIEVCV